MKTNDLKKGAIIQLENGWFATLEDNQRGNIRMATVDGLVKEMGSVYGHDIAWYRVSDETKVASIPEEQFNAMKKISNGEWKGFYFRVEHTPAQVKAREMTSEFFSTITQ